VKEPHDANIIDSDKSLVKAFHREANNLYKINHPNIVDFYGAVLADEDDEPVYAIVTEVLDQTLDDYLKQTTSTDEKHSIITSLAGALAHLHSMNILHRDIKPQNIMFNQQNTAKIIDFGLSKEKEDIQMTSHNTTQYAGTERWMSPEKRNGGRSTPASDVYSFGLVMFYILTGKEPSVDIMSRKDIESALKKSYGMDDVYSRLVLKCIDSDVNKRPTSSMLATALLIGSDVSFTNELDQSVIDNAPTALMKDDAGTIEEKTMREKVKEKKGLLSGVQTQNEEMKRKESTLADVSTKQLKRIESNDIRLTTINLFHHGIVDEDAIRLGNALENNNTIKEIYLGGNSIGDEGATAIGKALETNKTITTIDLRFNNIGDEGARAIGKALENNNTIKEIGLDYNSIGDEGARAIGKALETNNTITTIDLLANNISNEIRTTITTALEKNEALLNNTES